MSIAFKSLVMNHINQSELRQLRISYIILVMISISGAIASGQSLLTGALNGAFLGTFLFLLIFLVLYMKNKYSM